MNDRLADQKTGAYRPPPIGFEVEQTLLVNNDAVPPLAALSEPDHLCLSMHDCIQDTELHHVGCRGSIAVVGDMRDAACHAPFDRRPTEHVEGAESKLHELLKGVQGARSERRSICTDARKTTVGVVGA